MINFHHNDEEKGRCGSRSGVCHIIKSNIAVAFSVRARSKPNVAIVFVALACLLSVGFLSDMLSDSTNNKAIDFRHDDYNSSPRMLLSEEEEEEEGRTATNDEDTGTSNSIDGPTFVFIMGIEGTGHHFINDLLAQSPNMQAMQHLNMCNPTEGQRDNEFFQLSSQFMSTSNGMFDPNKRYKNALDVSVKYNKAVGLLKSISDKVVASWQKEQPEDEQQQERSSEDDFHIAINANSCNTPTMMSYPSFIGPDRALQNFNLDVFYMACADAQVKCKHMYIYRDPYDVLQSTTRNRRYNPNMYDSIRLYTSVLQQIHSQMVSHSEKNLGCFGFLDAAGYNIQNDWERFWKLWWRGWGDEKDTFENFMDMAKRINTKHPIVMDDTMKGRLVPPRLSVMMRAFEDIYHRVNDYCYSNLPSTELEGDSYQALPMLAVKNTDDVADEGILDKAAPPPGAIAPSEVEVA